ncbi:MAG: F0F1 ATP synthase subunit gamma [Actinobacteria bacterium]|nr:F0F1 ATP synthase subunit gamma [Actinomycetota bacterium]MBU1493835.1 F0F1 ATP synthase subunit gamma [Actinomycetota bacterium]
MASAELRAIRRRIKSVQSTMKITRAMELIAASRIVKAHQRVSAAQPYTRKMAEVVGNVGAASGGAPHPLLEHREVETAGVLVVSSDRGLAGAYNTNVIRMAEARLIELAGQGVDTRVYVVGKRAQSYLRYRGYRIERAFLGITDTPGYGDARAIANLLMNDYAEGTIDSVEAYSTEYVSALTQTAARWPILPIIPPEKEEGAGEEAASFGYSYEPSAATLLGLLLPRYVEAAMFGLLLDASASEHAARRRAMKAATENADDLTRLLSRQANQARQAEITTEISEIVGGAEALTQG